MKHSKIFSILFCRCPHCHHGKMFKPAWLFKWWDFGRMNERCDVCGQTFYPEPGFYFGAAYVSYIFGVALAGITWIIMWKLHIDSTKSLLLTILALLLFFAPYNYKLSRSSWLNLFGKIKN